jgi:hypothetical protein
LFETLPNNTKQHHVTTAVTCYSEPWVPVIYFRCARIGSVRMNFKQLYLHTHWKLDTFIWTYLLGIVHTNHLLKYLLLLLKHPVYTQCCVLRQKILCKEVWQRHFLIFSSISSLSLFCGGGSFVCDCQYLDYDEWMNCIWIWLWTISGIITSRGNKKYSEKNLYHCYLYTTNSTSVAGIKPEFCVEELATNCSSSGM